MGTACAAPFLLVTRCEFSGLRALCRTHLAMFAEAADCARRCGQFREDGRSEEGILRLRHPFSGAARAFPPPSRPPSLPGGDCSALAAARRQSLAAASSEGQGPPEERRDEDQSVRRRSCAQTRVRPWAEQGFRASTHPPDSHSPCRARAIPSPPRVAARRRMATEAKLKKKT